MAQSCRSRRQDSRLHVGDGRAGLDADARRLRRDGRADRIADASRHGAHAVGRFQNNHTGPDASGLVRQLQRGQVRHHARPSAIRPPREVVFDLVRWADVVTESFSPKAMRAWGFDYEALRKVKPDIIMLSSCLMGQTGPLANSPVSAIWRRRFRAFTI